MINIGNTNFSTNYWDENISLLEYSWINQENGEMTEEDFKNALLHYIDLVLKYKPNFVLVNTKKLKFLITVELQTWVDENINKISSPILKKMAVLLPEGFMEQLGVEQVLDEAEAKKISVLFFEDEQKAKEWLV